jgi:hypothetical protein
MQSFTSRRHEWQMKIGWSPQHYHLENVVVGDVEHDIHTWTVANIGPIAVKMT